MKFFKHYKEKPYKYIGEAKHSETLEDVVVYETRYESSTAKLWVRPKDMFFGSVEAGGQAIPRFKEIPLQTKEVVIKNAADITDSDLRFISAVMEKAFGGWDAKRFYSTFNHHSNFYLITAAVENEPAAFKLGYEMADREFYSWLGGVVPDFRGLGIAADLMKMQHEWCKKNGFTRIQTKTQNQYREMLLLNIRSGFNITGFNLSDDGEAKITLEKRL